MKRAFIINYWPHFSAWSWGSGRKEYALRKWTAGGIYCSLSSDDIWRWNKIPNSDGGRIGSIIRFGMTFFFWALDHELFEQQVKGAQTKKWDQKGFCDIFTPLFFVHVHYFRPHFSVKQMVRWNLRLSNHMDIHLETQASYITIYNIVRQKIEIFSP